ncbi:uncharacterized protein AMSG_01609 [Thecamonas trahens ATCC 50062]|uniref:G-protein coupled receptors family 2 profile 2 domain-containing protein n=1 Tax=Thecamonas trahens ATCC 50062 TaxID=461836 RepID=A0A0L0DTH4_THETB|nr:hypothetical protein AMSG_01609 [Thecamonas trahens ATCC 50062]KNC54758.1 hypothetical protein AMSG_01609 [Thecamonas trahens ATCC 50062]|eukprot:XP_013761658.1 hypothetical protein AMSG_01609 [Thecamonas trahens ATCC 50062]
MASLDTVAAIACVCGLLSVAGCVVNLLAFGVVVRRRSPTSRLLVALTAADLGQAVFFALAPLQLQRHPDTVACTIQAAAGMLTACASFLWTLCIAGYVFWVAKAAGSATASNSARRSVVVFSHIVSWGYPALFLVALFVAHPHMVFADPVVPWCFIPRSHPFWRMASVYFPLVVCWLATAVLYCAARAQLRARVHRNQHYAKFAAIPLGFIVLRVWGMAFRLAEFSASEPATSPQTEWLLYLTVIGDPLQGAYNCVVFVLASPPVRAALVDYARTGKVSQVNNEVGSSTLATPKSALLSPTPSLRRSRLRSGPGSPPIGLAPGRTAGSGTISSSPTGYRIIAKSPGSGSGSGSSPDGACRGLGVEREGV